MDIDYEVGRSLKGIGKLLARQSYLLKRVHSSTRVSLLGPTSTKVRPSTILLEPSTLFARSRDFLPCKMSASTTRRSKTPSLGLVATWYL